MKSAKPWYAIAGCIIFESIWIIELAVELYTGRMTLTEFICILAFSLVVATVIINIIKSKRQKSKDKN